MGKIVLQILAIMFTLSSYSQTVRDIGYIPLLDSNGNITAYIRKSDSDKYNHPIKNTKVLCYDEDLNIIGYWLGIKKKYFKIKKPKE